MLLQLQPVGVSRSVEFALSDSVKLAALATVDTVASFGISVVETDATVDLATVSVEFIFVFEFEFLFVAALVSTAIFCFDLIDCSVRLS